MTGTLGDPVIDDTLDENVEGEMEISHGRRLARGLSPRALVPNAITAAALCSGLTGIRFAIAGDFPDDVPEVEVTQRSDPFVLVGLRPSSPRPRSPRRSPSLLGANGDVGL